MPKPSTPAAQYSCKFSGVTPPVGISNESFGSTARQAFRILGGSCSPGKAFTASAPKRSAAKASVGVAHPGMLRRPSSLVLLMTDSSMLGLTMSMPPASATLCTSSATSTVPAPTTTSAGTLSASSLMLEKASGEFRGTSTIRKPASTTTLPTSTASSGLIPLKIVTMGQALTASIHFSLALAAASLCCSCCQTRQKPLVTASAPEIISASMLQMREKARLYLSHNESVPTMVTAEGRAPDAVASRISWPRRIPDKYEERLCGGNVPAKPSVRHVNRWFNMPPGDALRSRPASKACQSQEEASCISLPKIECFVNTSNISPVILVWKDTMLPAEVHAHLECVPGSTKRLSFAGSLFNLAEMAMAPSS
mmetsp:Transcript_159368/g.290711  ORF Transcript_159368/g.290711 Transcript_159368/m.290711 type:complete len:367 (+) Transcript_159368:275-1375(+)